MNPPSYGYSATDGSQPQEQPVCPRHPDRISYVSCKRCGRPACPDCQRPTSVGILCVDCDRELSRQQASARPRNAMGGAMGSRTPVVTYTIIAVCALLFLGQYVSGGLVERWLMYTPVTSVAMPWTFLTSGFLHGNVMHILFNMYALWAVGQFLEQKLGHVRYAALFLVSVLGGHVAVFLLASPFSEAWVTGTVGASGGVFGIFAATFIVQRRMGVQAGSMLVLIALNVGISFLVPTISWQGHLGGMIAGGAVAGAMYALRPSA
ncbi:MAG TPA: rhomboid family intramembrane serine protease, partial [Candidatus Brachybacterium merdigallinarum]|nr:rhomboid family intramembrane serine protease [Candidatus Brachybacterium merdigallinarum]